MALAGRQLLSRQVLSVESVLPPLCVIYAVLIVWAQVSGRLPLADSIVLLILPGLAWVAVRAPARLVLLYVGLPPGLLLSAPRASVGALTLLIGATIVAFLITRWRVNGGSIVAAAPIAALFAGTFLRTSDLSSTAYSAATEFRRALVLYVIVFTLAYILSRAGELKLSQVGTAMLISAAAAGVVFLWQTGFQPWTYSSQASDLDPGGLFYRTHFGYMMAIGFAIALARVLSQGRRRWIFDIIVLAFFSTLVIFSFTRGAWLVALVLVTILPIRRGKRGYWLVLPVIALIATGVPLIEERLLSDLSGGLQQSLESGDLGTGRWGLWRELMPRVLEGFPLGHGFGYVWSLSPESLFGTSSFTSETNPFVYVHNDFIYWALELGLVGLALLLAFWVRLLAAVRKVGRLVGGMDHTALVGGVILTMFVASMVDNGLFIRPVAERFFVVAGVMLALKDRTEESVPAEPVVP
jgi:O-antigen ligase